ncbi:MAG: glutaminyl-peptide cyclotransferase [Deltaproteobacteria bacterium]|nr:glutaminyl-peptide cyclotransferase [Deltaproteobacteria bacterium]
MLPALLILSRLALAGDTSAGDSAVPVYGYEVVAEYDHDPQAFTQGLCFDQGMLYEGTGLYGQSSLRRMTLDGKNLELRTLPGYLFGEGVTIFDDRVIQLTWKEHTGMVWDRRNLRFKHSFSYNGEGWGLTHDGRHLIMSDGSAELAFLDPTSFALRKKIMVLDHDMPVLKLNELEYIKGEIWANIWKESRIALINHESGRVTGWLDLSALVARAAAPGDVDSVLNGIAYDKELGRIFVTGKRWNRIYEIRIADEKKLPHQLQ